MMDNGAASAGIALRAHDPFFWLKQAKELDRAAMLIWAAVLQDSEWMSQFEVGAEIRLEQVPHVNLGRVFWLNAGFALENLLKGIIVKDKPDSVINGRITGHLKTHNLFKLAKRASIDLNVIEAFYLWVGTQCVMWAGRYPCSTKPEETAPPVFSESDVIAYRSLFDRLEGQFDTSKSKVVTFSRLA